jgi:chaperonin GroEL
MEKGVLEVVNKIKEMAVPVKDTDVAKVATISAQSEEIGKLIADALEKLEKTEL